MKTYLTNGYPENDVDHHDEGGRMKMIEELRDENEWIGRQASNARREVVKVRQIVEGSEHDRLSERKEKLAVVRKLIDLTKKKRSLEEEVEDYKKKYNDNSEYLRLYDKYEQALDKIKYLRENCATENELIQKGYLDELRRIKFDYEKDIRNMQDESENFKNSLDVLRASDEYGAGETMSSIEDLKNDFPEIVKTLSKEGIVDETSTGRQIILNLFKEYQRLFKEIRDKMDLSFQDQLQDIQKEKVNLQKELGDAKKSLSEQEKNFQIEQDSLKSQVDETLSEKKKAILELEKTKDEYESIKGDLEIAKTRLQNSKETLSKRTGQLTITQDNLNNLTEEMQLLDGQYEAVKRQVAVKDAEIARLQQDLADEKERRLSEKERSTNLQERLDESKNDETSAANKKNADVQLLQRQIEELEAELTLRAKENEDRLQEMKKVRKKNNGIENELFEQKNVTHQHENLIATLKEQNAMLEKSFQERVSALSDASFEHDASVEDLGKTKKLLSERDGKIEEQNEEIEKLVEQTAKQRGRILNLMKELEETKEETIVPNLQIPKINMEDRNIDEDRIIAQNESRQHSAPPIDEDVIMSIMNSTQESAADELDWLMRNTPQQQENVKKLEEEKDKFWKDCLEKDRQLDDLSKLIEQKDEDKNLLAEQLKNLERQNQEEIGKLLQQMSQEKKLLSEQLATLRCQTEEAKSSNMEKGLKDGEQQQETLQCLKVLVADNEAYAKCIANQQNIITSMKDESIALRRKLNDAFCSYEEEYANSMRIKAKLKSIMKASSTEENQFTAQQKQEIESLRRQVEEMRVERQKLKIDLDEKNHALDRTQTDLTTLKGAIEYNLESERRSKEFIEEQLKLVVQDRGHTLIKLKSTELANKILQNKLRELQKWHNDLEFKLLNSTNYERVTIQANASDVGTISKTNFL